MQSSGFTNSILRGIKTSAITLRTFGLRAAGAVVPFIAAVCAGTVVGAGTTHLIRLSPASQFAACQTAGEDNPSYVNAEAEPYVAVNPVSAGTPHANLIAVWQQDRLINGMAAGLVAASSLDDGVTWVRSALPFTSCVTGGPDYDRATDPWVSIGPDGTAYAVGAAFRDRVPVTVNKTAVLVAISADGGRTWGRTRVVGGTNGADKPSVTADPYRPRHAYVVWNGTYDKRGLDDTWFSKTTDGGSTWSPPQGITSSHFRTSYAVGHIIVVHPKTHNLYDFFGLLTQRPSTYATCASVQHRKRCRAAHQLPGAQTDLRLRIAFITSHDGGTNWSQPKTVAENLSAGPADGSTLFPRNGRYLPSVAVNRATGEFYVAWQDARFNGGRYDGIAMSSSNDAGKHWTKPRRINMRSGEPTFDPTLAITRRGILGLTYYSPSVTAADVSLIDQLPSLPTTYRFVSSSDGGAHFGNPVQLGPQFDIKTAPPTSGYFVGDYQGLVASGHSFHPVFVLANSGNIDNRTDVFTTTLRVGH